MDKTPDKPRFQSINRGYNQVFKPKRLSIGLVVPLEHYPDSSVPTMKHHVKRIQLAESLGFSSVWLRDVPFNVPSFGDAGQTFDPFVYLGLLAGKTEKIALGVASIILPLRHPAHVAKAATSADVLSDGRVILGVASGDRPDEYPALNASFTDRGERFRQSLDYISNVSESSPSFENDYGRLQGDIDMLPKPTTGKLPLLITGSSQQSSDWIAQHGNGWMTYPRPAMQQANMINQFRDNITDNYDKPVMEPLYIDLVDSPDTPPTPIHLGLRLGAQHLTEYLHSRANIGVNHIALNLRFNQANIETTLQRLADEVLPDFTQ